MMPLLVFVVFVVIVAVACTLTYVAMRRSSRQSLAEFRRAAEDQFSALSVSVAALQKQIQQLSTASATRAAARPSAIPQPPAPQAAPVPTATQEITPDLLVVMAAAVTAFLGKKVRIRSARALQSPYEIVNPWSQQGRVIVQASHNLRSTG